MQITKDLLHEYLCYDPVTGEFSWLRNTSYVNRVGMVAGGINTVGYIQIGFMRGKYLAHRLAWLYTIGHLPIEVDHRNGIRSDNRWTNLREATRIQNARNSSTHRDNKAGIKGVCRDSQRSRWIAQICIDGRQTHLGRFDSEIEAQQAYVVAAERHFGEFARW